jgi:hypoxanthine phosphoribosyltransferase
VREDRVPEPKPTVLHTEAEIRVRVAELAERISRDYADADELYLVGVLKGAFIFLADLCRALSIRHRVDFVALASYGTSTESSGHVRLILDLKANIAGKHVLIVDDIIDTGSTLQYLMNLLSAHEPASVKSCVLVRKVKQRREEVDVDYVGFDIDDVWVVGYGLDYADRNRTLPYIGVVRPPESD